MENMSGGDGGGGHLRRSWRRHRERRTSAPIRVEKAEHVSSGKGGEGTRCIDAAMLLDGLVAILTVVGHDEEDEVGARINVRLQHLHHRLRPIVRQHHTRARARTRACMQDIRSEPSRAEPS